MKDNSEINGQVVLKNLLNRGTETNENDMPVVRLIEGNNNHVTTYLRYDAVVKEINSIIKSQSLPVDINVENALLKDIEAGIRQACSIKGWDANKEMIYQKAMSALSKLHSPNISKAVDEAAEKKNNLMELLLKYEEDLTGDIGYEGTRRVFNNICQEWYASQLNRTEK